MFFSRRVSGHLDTYIKDRGEPAHGPLFVTARRARNPRRTDLTAEGYARLSYRQADTLWKGYTPGWDLHQLRHTAISARAARGYTEVELKRFSGHTSLRSLEVYMTPRHDCLDTYLSWTVRQKAVPSHANQTICTRGRAAVLAGYVSKPSH